MNQENNGMDQPFANIPDTQASIDLRRIPIDQVGIKRVRLPVRVAGNDQGCQDTVAEFSLSVSLPGDRKGTHMSRFLEVLHEWRQPFAQRGFRELLQTLQTRLDAESVYVEMRFPYFLRKQAPVTGVESLLDCEAGFAGRLQGKAFVFTLSLDLAFKRLVENGAERGALNQRSRARVQVDLAAMMSIEDLAESVEAEASCELYALLKRADEKYVTERAYARPRSVEEMARGIATRLERDARVRRYALEIESFDSSQRLQHLAGLQRQKG